MAPARRGRGEGSVFWNAEKNAYEGRIELPPGPDGKRRTWRRRRKKKADLLALMDEARRNLAHTGDIPTTTTTVEQWFDYWMREIAMKDRRPKTINSYRSIVKIIDSAIGRIRLDRVTPATVRKVFASMEAEDLSSTYMRNAHSVMSAAFGDAEREGRIQRNPVELVRAPRKSAVELEALTPAEAGQLIETFRASDDAYLWATFLLTGARRSEILGLEWDRVTDVLDLSWQLQRIGKDQPVPADFESRQVHGGLYLTRPKTRSGWRILPLVDPLRSILAQWRASAPENPWGLVFTRTVAGGGRLPVDPDWASKRWPEVREAAGIHRDVRLHDLRHGTAAYLYAANVPEDVIEAILGHSTAAMSRHYRGRVDQARLIAGMTRMSAVLAGNS